MRKHMKKTLYLILGSVFVILAIIGIFLPLLPTTPFLILAAFFFSQSSERCHQWLLNNKVFGPILYSWENSRCIPAFAKKLSFVMIFIFGTVSIITLPVVYAKVFTFLLISYACYFIYNLQTCVREQVQSD